jgi:hypothetical protein
VREQPSIALWALFRIVPPPGAEAVEAVDMVGLFTKATELVAVAACTVLWLRARRTPPENRERQVISGA